MPLHYWCFCFDDDYVRPERRQAFVKLLFGEFGGDAI